MGKAIATSFVANGAQVILSGRDEPRGNSLSAELGENAVLAILEFLNTTSNWSKQLFIILENWI